MHVSHRSEEDAREEARIVEYLGTAFPELSDTFEDNVNVFGIDCGAIFLYDMILCPFLHTEVPRLIDSANPTDQELLARLVHFFEEMASHPDPRWEAVAATSIAECIRGTYALRDAVHGHLGPHMARLVIQ